jgi:hypothetical protein
MGQIKNGLGTKVLNPVHRSGYAAFKPCCYCGLQFTSLGLSRHWDKCPKKGVTKS